MRLNKEQKVALVKELTQKIKQAKSVVILGYQGTNVAQMTGLRQRLRDKGIELQVIKNRLLQRALASCGFELSQETLRVPLAVVISSQDEIEGAKQVVKASQEAETLRPLSGVFEGQVVDEKYIQELAALPGKEELLAKLVATIKGPMAGLQNALKYNLGGLINILKSKE